MTSRLFAAAGLVPLLLTPILVAPAFAVAPRCEAQLAEIKIELDEQPGTKSSVGDKYRQAERLCAEQKDLEAERLVREIRQEISWKTGSGLSSGPATGSGAAKSGTTTQ